MRSIGDARQRRWQLQIIEGGAGGSVPPSGGGLGEPEPVFLSDDFLAQELSDRVLHDDWLYCAAWREWLQFDSQRWVKEPTLLIDDIARRVCREAAAPIKDKRLARVTDSAQAASRAERLVRAMRRHAATPEQFDSRPLELNTPGGIVDLATGDVTPHRRDSFLTHMTAVAPSVSSDDAACPTWLRVLDEASGGDMEVVAFLQRLFGYSLVGTVTEHVVVVLHGATGGEGKTLILNAVSGAMGSYSAFAPADLLTPQQGERHSTDLAGLAGARLVIASEIEDAKFWAEAKLKSISGGDKVTARFMRGNFFTYTPQFTLIVATNTLPQLRSAGGMRRRLKIVPFRHPPPRPDPDLPEKLRAEWPGILAWMIDGALLWRRDGLAPPAAVNDATDEYFAAENAVGLWVADRCERDLAAETPTKELHRDFRSWAAGANEPQLSERRFVQRLSEAGFQRSRIGGKGARSFVGLRLQRGAAGGLTL